MRTPTLLTAACVPTAAASPARPEDPQPRSIEAKASAVHKVDPRVQTVPTHATGQLTTYTNSRPNENQTVVTTSRVPQPDPLQPPNPVTKLPDMAGPDVNFGVAGALFTAHTRTS